MKNAKVQIEAQRSGRIDLERRSHEVICSFRGTYANRGNGMEPGSSDVVTPAGFEPGIAALKVR